MPSAHAALIVPSVKVPEVTVPPRIDSLASRVSVVVAISARATASLRRKLRDAGADELLRKGLDDPVAARTDALELRARCEGIDAPFIDAVVDLVLAEWDRGGAAPR